MALYEFSWGSIVDVEAGDDRAREWIRADIDAPIGVADRLAAHVGIKSAIVGPGNEIRSRDVETRTEEPRGAPYDNVTVRRRRYEPSSSRFDVKLFGPTWFRFSPTFGYFASVFVGVHASYQRALATFARG